MAITPLPTAPNKYTDTPAEFTTKADAWVAALATFTTQANALEVNVNSKESAASASASAASSSASAAAASAASALAAPGTNATSATSLTVGSGSKVVTTQSGKSLVTGMKVLLADNSDSTVYMYGTIVSYAGTTLTVSVESYSGSGTYNDWTISITGPANTIGSVPVGSIIPWVGGYFTNGSNGGYTNALPDYNTVEYVNNYLNPQGWYVCNGASLAVDGSPLFPTGGVSTRYLPNLTDSRFIQGSTTAGGTGGSSTMAHTHTGPSHVHTTAAHTLTVSEMPAHTHAVLESWGGEQAGVYAFDPTALITETVSQTSTRADVAQSAGGGASHSHGNTGSAGTGNTGAASNAENRPLFLSCFYIMRVR